MKKILNRKTGVKSIYAALMALGLVIVILLNIAAGALADRYPLSIDLTRDRLFGLGEETVSYIEKLEEPLKIQVLATEETFRNNSTYNAQANEVMRQFARYSDAIEIEYIDYISDPTFAASYPDLTMKHGDVLVTSGERHRLVKTEELFNYTYDQKGRPQIASSRAEEAILSAVLALSGDEIPVVAVITGHGETVSEPFLRLLTTNNYDVQKVNLLTGGLPEDAKIALLPAPITDLSAEEIEMLDAFLKNGGAYGKTLFYTASPEQPPLSNTEAFLAEWGVKIGDGLVFETKEDRVYFTQPFYAIADYAEEHYSSKMADRSVPMLVPVSRPLEITFRQQENYFTEELLRFGETSGVRPSDAGDSFTASDAAQRGPLPAMVLCSYRLLDSQNGNAEKASSHILVSGSTELLANYAVGNRSFANGEYLIHVLNDLCERSDAIAVTPKSIVGNALNLTQAQGDRLGYLFVLAIPVVVLGVGVAVWLGRRHK